MDCAAEGSFSPPFFGISVRRCVADGLKSLETLAPGSQTVLYNQREDANAAEISSWELFWEHRARRSSV